MQGTSNEINQIKEFQTKLLSVLIHLHFVAVIELSTDYDFFHFHYSFDIIIMHIITFNMSIAR